MGGFDQHGLAPDVPRLSVWLLGGCRIAVGSRRIGHPEWRLRKAQSLVKLLALEPSHRLHHEQIQELLWPEFSPESAASNLRKALHFARRVLEPDDARMPSYLQRQGDLLALAPAGRVWIDVEAFEAAAAAARRSREPAAYLAAIDLYAGDLLPEDRYEEWVGPRSEQLRSEYLALLRELALLYEAQEQRELAVEQLRRLVASEPVDEQAHLGLMRLLAGLGQRHQALRQYRQLKDALRREMDAEPDTASQQLYEEIRTGRFPGRSELEASPARPEPVEEPAPSLPKGRARPRASTLPSPASLRHNLPALLTRFIGRDSEKAELRRLLATARLLSLTGAGGCGKSRLALEVGRGVLADYPDGVWLVELSGLADPSLVPQTVAATLALQEEANRPLVETLADRLRPRRLLLLLDNCEHLIEACATLAHRLLHACPDLRILATSRQPMGVPGEVAWPVPSLSLPDPQRLPPVERLQEYEAVQLFLDRARLAQPDFALESRNAPFIATICHQLDGMPLAIELAAARARMLSVEQIAARLSDRFGLLTGGARTATQRQQTLRATVDWSYELLAPPEQGMFGRLSVFAGRWTLEAAESVAASEGVLDLLEQLVDKSLVIVEPSSGGLFHYRLLETLRQYGLERLAASGEAETVRDRHASYYLALAERAEPELAGPAQAVWLDRLEQNHDNLRAALEWWKAGHSRLEESLRMASALWRFWWLRGYLSEGRAQLEALLAQADGSVPPTLRVKGLHALGTLGFRQGDYPSARAHLQHSLAIAQEIGDSRQAALARRSLGRMAIDQQDFATASALLEQALAVEREQGSAQGVAWCLNYQALLSHFEGRNQEAQSLLEQTLATLRELDDRWGVAVSLYYLGRVGLDLGDGDLASTCWTESLAVCNAERYLWCIPYLLEGFGYLAAAYGDPLRAVRLAGAASALHEIIGAPLPPVWRADFERRLDPVRRLLDAASHQAAWDEGRSMSLDQASEHALAAARIHSR